MKYKIEKKITRQLNQTETDSEYSIAETVRYYIKYQKTLFGIFRYWKYYKTKNCTYHGCISSPLAFRSLEAAKEFAVKYISKGITHDAVTKETELFAIFKQCIE